MTFESMQWKCRVHWANNNLSNRRCRREECLNSRPRCVKAQGCVSRDNVPNFGPFVSREEAGGERWEGCADRGV